MAIGSGIAQLLAVIGMGLLCAATAWGAAPAVCKGSFHGVALRSDGRVLTWGNDQEGQLGLGRLLQRTSPAPIPFLQGVTAVAVGSNFGMALLADGRVATWGGNSWGQRGVGDVTFYGNEITFAKVANVVAISAGPGHAAALTADGRIWMWGDNYSTQLGDGTNHHAPTPRMVEGMDSVVHVSTSYSHTVAVRRDGSVWAWGDPFAVAERGNLANFDAYSRPVRIAGIDGARAASAGGGYTLVVREDRTVWAWGANRDGELGVPGEDRRMTPAAVPGVTGITALAAGDRHAVALREDGLVLAWGDGRFGQQGTGEDRTRQAAHVVPGLADVIAIAAGSSETLALRSDHMLWGWGNNGSGQLARSPREASQLLSPAPLGIAGVDAMATSGAFTVAVSGGRLMAWGDNTFQQLASGSARDVNQTTPVLVPGLENVAAIACSGSTSLALKGDGSLWGWGRNAALLGAGAAARQSTPVAIAGLPTLALVAGTSFSGHLLAVDRAGTLWTWGFNDKGQLGRAGETGAPPAVVPGLPPLVALATGSWHSLAVDRDGNVWSWGLNDHGQLGDGSLITRTAPARVAGLSRIAALAAGGSHSMALGDDGRVWSWGNAKDGQLGIGFPDEFEQPRPAPIESLAGAVGIAAGFLHSFAILGERALWGWGANFFGALGDDSEDFIAFDPVRIRTDAPIAGISAASTHSSAWGTQGPVFGWGLNIDAELGDGTLADRRAPALMLGIDGAGFFNLSPEKPLVVPSSKVPAFLLVATGSVATSVVADLRFNPTDVGTSGGVYVFAWAPAARVKRLTGAKLDAACVLAQLTATGELKEVTASSLQAYVSGILGAQGQAVTVLNGQTTAVIGGTTFYVGYGSTPTQMLSGGNNRSVVSVAATECKPQAPQAGWWWNPAEPGRGFSIEISGNRIFFAAYMYEASGRSTWYVASGKTSLDGSLFSGVLESYSGGQTLAGAYRPAAASSVGPIALAFSDASRGTMVLPGQGAVPIERFNIVPNGLKSAPRRDQPESGWWWNESESGRGYYIEWQGGSAFLAGYMYDDAGNPLWYASQATTPNAQSFAGAWSQYGNGQVLGGATRPPSVVNSNVAPVTIQFSGAESGLMTLPGGRQSPIKRFRF